MLIRMLKAIHFFGLDNQFSPSNSEHLFLFFIEDKAQFFELYPDKGADGEVIENYLMWNPNNCLSAFTCFKNARENGRQIREIISNNVWEVINRLYLWLQDEQAKDLYTFAKHQFYLRLEENTALLKGNFVNSMWRDDYSLIMKLGILVERVNQIAYALDRFSMLYSHSISVSPSQPDQQLKIISFLLDSLSSADSYLRAGYDFHLPSAQDFFLNEKRSPYSLVYCLNAINDILTSLNNRSLSFRVAHQFNQELIRTIYSLDNLKMTPYHEMAVKPHIEMLLEKLNSAIENAFGQDLIEEVVVNTHSVPSERLENAPISPDNPLILNEVCQVAVDDKKLSKKFIGLAKLTTENLDDQPNIYAIYHDSSYHYSSEITMSKHLFRLQPVHDFVQNLLYYKLTCSVNGKFCNFLGAFGNRATIFDISEPYTDLYLKSFALVTISSLAKQRYDLLHQQHSLPLVWMPWDQIMMQAYLTPPELPESELHTLSDYARSFVARNNNDIWDVLNDINRTIYNDYVYLSGSTTLSTTPFQVFVTKRGVCQDFANLFVCLARLLNIPARYRVGYIYTGSDYENKQQGDATHAWIEVFLPNIGWMGFDPTNCCTINKNHIRVASGRHYGDATPTAGTIYNSYSTENFSTSVKVIKLTPEELEKMLKEL